MTYTIAIAISLVLFLPVGWISTAIARRTVYSPIRSEDGTQSDEQGERDRVKGIREQGVKKVFKYYFGIVAVLFLWAALAEPAKKVQAALWPTLTPTFTITPFPTVTRTPSNTPTPSRTPQEGEEAGNFLTTIANVNTTGTPNPIATRTPFLPSGGSSTGGSGNITVVQTRIVVQTQIVVVTQVHYYPVTVVVVVTATNTPTPESVTETFTPSPTFTNTPSPTATQTETPSP